MSLQKPLRHLPDLHTLRYRPKVAPSLREKLG
ncbi:MAG: hypothetical protein ACI836_001398 [Saprospiraceae bacterium]|jgi:hypothetical protein